MVRSMYQRPTMWELGQSVRIGDGLQRVRNRATPARMSGGGDCPLRTVSPAPPHKRSCLVSPVEHPSGTYHGLAGVSTIPPADQGSMRQA
jgi:hypothetical protein